MNLKNLSPKNNVLARKATKRLGDHYARMFAQIALQEGITDCQALRDFVCNMSVDDFCNYKFTDPISDGGSDTDLLEGNDDE